jgi:FkbM family methyltransferase
MDWGSERVMMDNLDSEGAFLDIGAHIGYYAAMAMSFVAHVVAFEPDPRNLPYLRAIASPRLTVVDAAVDRVSGTRLFELGTDPATSHLADKGIEVAVVTIDEFVLMKAIRNVTGIKVDVEGSDLNVLEGAQQTIRRDQPLVLTEFTRSDTNDEERLLALCAQLGYRPLAFVRPGIGEGHPRDRRMSSLPVERQWRYKMVFLVPPRLQDVASFGVEL